MDLLSDTHGAKKVAETQVKREAVELKSYSERFEPIKHFAVIRKRAPASTDLIIAADNHAAITIVQGGRPTALRCLSRAHRADLKWRSGVCSNPHVCMR